MSEQATPKPPWERTSREPRTDLDTCVLCASNYGYEDVAKRAWAELCALQSVAEAAEQCQTVKWDRDDDYDALAAALKEWRAICHR